MSDPIQASPVQSVDTPSIKAESWSATPAQRAPVAVPAQADPAESAAPVTKPEVQEQAQSKRFAELARRQRELFQKEQAIKEQESKLSPIQQAIEMAKQNPLKLLEAAGISYEELTEYILSGDEPAPAVDPIKAKLEELELKLTTKEKAEQEAAEQARAAAVEKQIANFKSQIAKEAESCELVSSLEQHDLVYDVILEHHATTGEVLPIQQALAAVEAYLEQQAQKVLSVPKFARAAPAAPQASPQPVPAQSSAGNVPFTLSARQAPPPANVAASSTEKMTRAQLMDLAIKQLRFKD